MKMEAIFFFLLNQVVRKKKVSLWGRRGYGGDSQMEQVPAGHLVCHLL